MAVGGRTAKSSGSHPGTMGGLEQPQGQEGPGRQGRGRWDPRQSMGAGPNPQPASGGAGRQLAPSPERGCLAGPGGKVDPVYETLRYGTSLALMNRSSFSSTSESPTQSLV